MELGIIVCGRAGQGLQLAAEMLGQAFLCQGYHVFVSMDVMSRIRGGHNSCRVRVSDRPVGSDPDSCQVLVALDARLAAAHFGRLDTDAVVIVDDAGGGSAGGELRVLAAPLERLATERGGSKVLANAVAVGCVLGLAGLAPEQLGSAVGARLRARDEGRAQRNRACLEAGYELVRKRARFGSLGSVAPRPQEPGRLLVSGAQAIALGAVAGGVRFVSGYPMSPGTSVLEQCAAWSERAGLVVEQAEDEVAALNQAVGASFAGRLGMVATAGGGFALMNEALSLAGMAEVPVVVCLGMRSGPATGMATRTAQADLLFATSAGHGEFPRAVLAPGDAAEAYDAARRAGRIAARYQTPVILLFDTFLGDALWTIDPPAFAGAPEPYWAGAAGPGYRRYEDTESGVSPFLLPGATGQLVYADSDEHTEEGHITETAAMRVRMVNKRLRKEAGIRAELGKPGRYPDADAKTAVLCFGSTKWQVKDAVERLRRAGQDVGMVHICDVWPFPAEALLELAGRADRVLTVENNYTAQLGRLVQQEAGLRVAGSVRKWDGRQFSVAEVESGIKELL